MKTDALARRSRFAPPNPLVRRLMLAEADYLIFEAINRHGPLPTHYLYEFAKLRRKDYTHFQKRLTELYNGDEAGPYLTRPPQQFAGFEAHYQHVVYDLALRAKTALAERGTYVQDVKRTDPFLHQLMQACVGASIELGARAKGIRYIPRPEILARARNPLALSLPGIGATAKLIPDDLFGFQYPAGGYRFFAVEIDRNTESIERKNLDYNTFGKKVDSYLRVLRDRLFDSWWDIRNLTVLTVTTNATHAANLIDHIRKQEAGKHAERFAFQCEPSFGANWRVPRAILSDLLDKPWSTVAAEKDIGQP